MDPVTAWFVVVSLWVAPIVHVALAAEGGTWRSAPGARCPFGPRTGWLVIVLILGAIGWLMFMAARRRRRGGAGRRLGGKAS